MEATPQNNMSPERRGARRLLVIVAVLLVAVLACVVILVRTTAHPLHITVFDVGQGDALFFETPTGEQMLVDGGPTTAVLEKLGRAMPFYDRTIDVVVLTHPDADHLTGLVEVVRRYAIGQLLVSGSPTDTATYHAFLDAVHDRGVPLTPVHAGDVVHLGDATLTVLAPFDATATLSTNNAGVVARFDADAFSMLLTGDVEAVVEQLLVKRNADLDTDVLKIGHHGSKTSSTETFLRAVSPDLGLISVGEGNRYGHPHPDVLRRYETLGIPLLRTDEGSDIRLSIIGEQVTAKRGIGFRLW